MSYGSASLKTIFKLLDKGRRGFLTATDLTVLMHKFGFKNNEGDVHYMLSTVDPTGSGYMSFSTFCKAMEACKLIIPKLKKEKAKKSKKETDDNDEDDEEEMETDEEDTSEEDTEDEDSDEDDTEVKE